MHPLALLLPLLLAACAQPAAGDLRRAWLLDALGEDYRFLAARDPALTRQTFLLMASTPHDFLRGTAAVFLRDATGQGTALPPTACATAAAARVAIVADPHLGNLGSFRDRHGVLLVDFNDFDGATYGPYWVDVRRLALSAAVLGTAAAELGAPDDTAARAARAATDGYAAEIAALAAGAPPTVDHAGDAHGDVLDELLDDAARDGEARAELEAYTVVDDAGTRRLRFGERSPPVVPGVIDDVLRPVDRDEETLVRALLARYPDSLLDGRVVPPGALAILGIGRRLGAGVRSFALARYYVLCAGPTGSPDDDWLLELKEATPAFPIAGPLPDVDRLFASNAERQVRLQRALQESAADDPLLGWAVAAPRSFKIRDRTAYQKVLSIEALLERIADGRWGGDDLVELAGEAGRLLARAHAGAAGADGAPGLAAIAAALARPGCELGGETAGFVDLYLPLFLADHVRFIELLADEGPLLGLP